jgi:hypothetical protein
MNGPDHPGTARLTDLTELRSITTETDADRLTPEQVMAVFSQDVILVTHYDANHLADQKP